MPTPKIGIALFDTRFLPAREAAASTYTEIAPIPGVPVPFLLASRWAPRVYGAQTQRAETLMIRGGYAGRDGGRVSYTVATQTAATDYRVWDEPNLLTGWDTPRPLGFGAGHQWSLFDTAAVVLPDSHKIVIVSRSGVAEGAKTWRYDPRTRTWESGFDWDLAGPVLAQNLCLAYDEETERLILWTGHAVKNGPNAIAYYSDDEGDTWQMYSRGFWGAVVTSSTATNVAPAAGRAWCAIADNQQFSSDDHGVSWQRVDTIAGTVSALSVTALPTGFLISYITSGVTLHPAVRFIANSRNAFADATPVIIDDTRDVSSVAIVRDYDGTLYAYTRGVIVTGGESSQICAYRSTDNGQTWARYERGVLTTGTDSGFPFFRLALAAAGSIFLVTTPFGATDVVGTIQLLRLGGWSSLEMGSGDDGYTSEARGGYGFDPDATTAQRSHSWYPIDFPEDLGFTRFTSGSVTRSFNDLLGVGYSIATLNNAQELYFVSLFGEDNYISGEATLHHLTGSTVDEDGTSAVLQVQLSGAAGYEYLAQIRIFADGLALYDGDTGSVQRAIVTGVDCTDEANPVHLRIFLTKGEAWAWYRLGAGTRWTRFANGVTITDNTTAGTDAGWWGHRGGGPSVLTTNTFWHHVGFAGGKDIREGGRSPFRNSPAGGPLGHYFSRSIPAQSQGGYPVPDVSEDPAAIALLAATGGPSIATERTNLLLAHTHPVRNLYPTLVPSPARYWESSDNGLFDLRWTFPDPIWIGSAVALVVLEGRPRLWVLECNALPGPGWETLCTLDLGADVDATILGDCLTAAPGTATFDYHGEGEFVGGYVVNNGVASDIIRQSPGVWDETNRQQIVITVRSTVGMVDGPTEIVRPSGVYVHHPDAELFRDEWRIRAVAGQVTPGGVYRAGIAAPARVVGLGTDAGFDWQQLLELQRTRSEDLSGRASYRKSGPEKRSVTYGWTGGVTLVDLRNEALPIRADSSSNPIGTVSDTWHATWGHLVQSLEGGTLPCVLLVDVPDTDRRILDSRQFLYGHISSDSQDATGVTGREGEDEAIRLATLTWEEVR
jgi:hypothetical protein